MTDNILAIDFNGVKILLDANTKLKRLTTGASGTVTLHDAENDTDYQVPAGKKATIIYIESTPSFSGTDRIISSTAADATTGETVLIQPASQITDLIFISEEISENLYITKVDPNTGTTILYVIEENA